MIVVIFSGLISIYVIIRLIWPMGRSLRSRLGASFALLLVSQYHSIIKSFSGTLASPEVPAELIMVCGWLYGAFILAASLCLIKDAGIFISYVLRKAGLTAGPPLKSRAVLYVICLVSLVLSGIGVWQAVKVPDVRRVEINLSNLPEEFDGLRIALLTDIHVSSLLEEAWVEQVVNRTNGLKPDLIVISGDIVDGLVNDRQADAAPLAQLSAPLGVYAVNGNHEYYSDYIGWMNKFPQLNLKMLFNAHAVITRGGAELVLAGTTDRAAERFNLPAPNLGLALAGAPAGVPVILLEHQPSGAVKNSEAGVDLQLSGHTHGGQFVGLRILSQWVNKGFISGLYQVGNMQLYVSNGTGLWSGLPVRIGVPSEITEITLRRKQ